MNSALLIIDIQNDYFPGGKMELEGSIEAGLRAKQILSICRENSVPVIHVQHFSNRPGATFFIPGTTGVEINECVKPLENELIIRKNFPNSFRNTSLMDYLKTNSIDTLVIAGMMTHMCIDATTRAAFDHGFNCILVGDACATRTLTFNGKSVPAENVHNAFLAAIGSVYAKVIRAEDILTGKTEVK